MQFKIATFLLSFLALSTCVVGFPMASPSEKPEPSTVILTIGGEGEPITFPASSLPTLSRRDDPATTEIDVNARQNPVLGRVIVQGITEIVRLVLGRIADDKDARSDFTRDFIQAALQKYPSLNWVICHPRHETRFDGVEDEDWGHDKRKFPVLLGSIGYDIYWFKSGTFILKGDGGYLNWAYGGYVLSRTDTDDSSTVVFSAW